MTVHRQAESDPWPQGSCSPLMKWPGGKRRLLQFILPHLRGVRGRYYEPFVGGGAVFFALSPQASVLADANHEVTNCYLNIKTDLDRVLGGLRKLRNSKEDYYQVRAWEPEDQLGRAIRTLYLARLSFNGIYRQNLSGKFNVPYGYKFHLGVSDEVHLSAASAALREADIRVGDFEATTSDARKGDAIYFDPPYTVAHGNNGFVKYNAQIFSWEDQGRLSSVAKRLVRRGCKVVISNADHPSIDALYPSFARLRIKRPSVIAADSEHRRVVTERLFVGEP